MLEKRNEDFLEQARKLLIRLAEKHDVEICVVSDTAYLDVVDAVKLLQRLEEEDAT